MTSLVGMSQARALREENTGENSGPTFPSENTEAAGGPLSLPHVPPAPARSRCPSPGSFSLDSHSRFPRLRSQLPGRHPHLLCRRATLPLPLGEPPERGVSHPAAAGVQHPAPDSPGRGHLCPSRAENTGHQSFGTEAGLPGPPCGMVGLSTAYAQAAHGPWGQWPPRLPRRPGSRSSAPSHHAHVLPQEDTPNATASVGGAWRAPALPHFFVRRKMQFLLCQNANGSLGFKFPFLGCLS